MMGIVLCETSQTVANAFRKRGHAVYTVDILPSDIDSDYHFIGDCIDVVSRRKWDFIIGHPPCTTLSVSGNSTYAEGMPKHQLRLDGIKWTQDLWFLMKKQLSDHPKSFCVLENPVGVLSTQSTIDVKPQYIQPYQFGHPESKKTGLWLYNVPPLKDTKNVKAEFDKLPKKQQQRLHWLPPSEDRWKIRSKTFKGIAKAMAQQWG